MNNVQSENWIQRLYLVAVLGTYLVSFFLPVFDAGRAHVMYGYQASFWGLILITYWPMWSANVALWIGCAYCNKRNWRAMRNVGMIAVLLAISEVWLWDDQPEIGYFMWVGSMVLLTLVGAIQNSRSRPVLKPLTEPLRQIDSV